MRTLAMPKTAGPWSLTSLREKLIKIGSREMHRVLRPGRRIVLRSGDQQIETADAPEAALIDEERES